ncbi:MAG TPA: hypothetical protein VMD75_13240 [Candidatus Binataceae bacterium]|nr:hypothetical protein [Candidatus Binataceae bacterium]
MASSDYMTIRDAVLKQLTVTASYDGYSREFCPHAIGTKNGEQHVLGYQFAGSSKSGLPPGGQWRCFVIARLQNVSTRSGPWRTGYSHTRPQACIDYVDTEVPY